MITKRAFVLFAVPVILVACGGGSPTSPDKTTISSLAIEQSLPPEEPSDEVYNTPSGFISTSQGSMTIPEGAIQIKLLKVQPGRKSVLIFDSPLKSSSAGFEFEITTRDLPADFYYWFMLKLVDEDGNELPTRWMDGGINGTLPDGIRSGHTYRISYLVPVDELRNIPSKVPSLRIQPAWGRSYGGFSGYLNDKSGSRIQIILRPFLDWHLP